MKVIRFSEPDQIKPVHVVMVCLVVATLAGSCLLTSGPQQDILHDGAVEWGPDSPLRAVIEVLNLRFAQTTAKGIAIKSLVFSIGASLAMLTLAFALGTRPRSGDEQSAEDIPAAPNGVPTTGSTTAEQTKIHIRPLTAAQFLMLAFGLWSLAGVFWATAPDFALGGSILLAISLMWLFALGLGLNRVAARACCYGLVIVSALTAVLALWYLNERNPVLRASYPIGNPLFLAACLIPGILIAGGTVVAGIQRSASGRRATSVLMVLVSLAALVVMLWAFYEAKSRGPGLGLLAGVVGMVMFALRGRGRAIAGVVLVVLLAGVLWWQFAQREAFSATGRDATLRLRLLAWGYGIDLAVESPLAGRGQGTYVLAADALAGGEDVLADPLALDARIAHAHNEWLEIWCDLGSIGLVLVAGAQLLTFWAGTSAIGRMPTPTLRWALISLLAALLALIVEEMFSPGLRVAGLPTVYFTVIGLIWAMSALTQPRWMVSIETARWPRVAAFVAAAALAVVPVVAGVRDFLGARAYYESRAQAEQQEWGQALELAGRARNFLLNPQRRLEATDRLCVTHLRAATAHQAEALRLTSQARQSDPPDERRLALADENRRRSVQYIQNGLSELGELLKQSPSSWNSGLWEQGFYVLLATFARADGDEAGAEANSKAAVTALERELRRRPFDPSLALTYASLAGSRLEIGPLFEILARPLRHKRPPALGYLGYLREIGGTPGFGEAFKPVYDIIISVTPEQPVAKWPAPWAPEMLRLAAYILADRGYYEDAVREVDRAAALYELLRESAPLGAASCHEELAECRFLAYPDQPEKALEAARRAIDLVPNSEAGRRLTRNVRSRTATYTLAAGDETKARTILGQLEPDLTDEALDAELGFRYSQLAHSALRRGPDPLPRRFAFWVERALQLNPKYETGWEEDELIRLLRVALEAGADRGVIAPFVNQVLSQRPESTGFKELQAELEAATTQPATTRPGPTSLPTTGQSPASQPPAAPTSMPAQG